MATHNQQVPTDPIDLSSNQAAHHVDRMLDEAIEDSFPSSDPVSLAMPHNRIEEEPTPAQKVPAAMRNAWPLAVVGGIIVALLLARRR